MALCRLKATNIHRSICQWIKQWLHGFCLFLALFFAYLFHEVFVCFDSLIHIYCRQFFFICINLVNPFLSYWEMSKTKCYVSMNSQALGNRQLWLWLWLRRLFKATKVFLLWNSLVVWFCYIVRPKWEHIWIGSKQNPIHLQCFF